MEVELDAGDNSTDTLDAVDRGDGQYGGQVELTVLSCTVLYCKGGADGAAAGHQVRGHHCHQQQLRPGPAWGHIQLHHQPHR